MTTEEMKKELNVLGERIKQLEAELSKIEAESEPEFERASHGEPYYYIYGNNMQVAVASDDSDYTSEVCYMHNNYFHTKERAQEVADKIKFLLKLERLHDIYCPDYVPDWNDEAQKYIISYNNVDNAYMYCVCRKLDYKTMAFFPIEEIAMKVCDILNKECENND